MSCAWGLVVRLTRRERLVCRLFTALADLDCDELLVIATIAERAGMGSVQYGSLNLATDKRNFRKETAEELVDACFYSTCELIRADGAIS